MKINKTLEIQVDSGKTWLIDICKESLWNREAFRETMKETYIELTEDVVYDEHDQDTILKIFCAAEGRMF